MNIQIFKKMESEIKEVDAINDEITELKIKIKELENSRLRIYNWMVTELSQSED